MHAVDVTSSIAEQIVARQYHRSWEIVEVIQLRVNAFMMENCGLVPQITQEIVDLITGMTGPIILRMSPR